MTGPWPSLEVIERELDRVTENQLARGTSLDTKAGLLLGFAGVLVTLGPDDPGVWDALAQGSAVFAGLASAWAFWPRLAGEINPSHLRDSYAVKDPIDTRGAVYATRALLYDRNEAQLAQKLARMKWAMGLLILSIAFALTATIVDVSKGAPQMTPVPIAASEAPAGGARNWSLSSPDVGQPVTPVPPRTSSWPSRSVSSQLWRPDPDLIGNAEGDKRALKADQEAAKQAASGTRRHG